MLPTGVILWRGHSEFDSRPIMAVAPLRHSNNRKVGRHALNVFVIPDPFLGRDMSDPRTWYLDRADICPHFCGYRCNPGHKGKCYVVWCQSVHGIWLAVKRGSYTEDRSILDRYLHRWTWIRLTAAGDPMAVPWEAWMQYLPRLPIVGYTADWSRDTMGHAIMRNFLMASVQSVAAARCAQQLGWNTFRSGTGKPIAGEDRCRGSCRFCRWCKPSQGRNIFNPVHGPAAVRRGVA